MDLKRKIQEKQDEIEKFLIILLFISVIATLFFKDNAGEIGIVTLVLQIALVLFYFLLVQIRLYSLFWLAFLLHLMSYFLTDIVPDTLLFIIIVLPYLAFGILILYKGIKASIQNKSFELLTFIVGFLLIIQTVLPFVKTNQEILTIYSFVLSFALGTIIYSDNLWHRYNSDEKNLLKFVLIVVLGIVILSSVKFI